MQTTEQNSSPVGDLLHDFRKEVAELDKFGLELWFAEKVAALCERQAKALEELGEQSNTCVGQDLGRRCSYCQCEGKNLTGK